jgi:hypothetical protein
VLLDCQSTFQFSGGEWHGRAMPVDFQPVFPHKIFAANEILMNDPAVAK